MHQSPIITLDVEPRRNHPSDFSFLQHYFLLSQFMSWLEDIRDIIYRTQASLTQKASTGSDDRDSSSFSSPQITAELLSRFLLQ